MKLGKDHLLVFIQSHAIQFQTATAELGELDLGPSAANWGNNNSSTSWAEAVDDNPNVENLAAEQKRREREEKHRQRQLEHEQRLRDKRSGSLRQAN